MKVFRVVLFGVGRAGKIHLKNILHHPQLDLVTVVDMDVEGCKTVLNTLGNITKDINVVHTSNMEKEVMEDKSIDAIIVCSPTDTHEDIILSACAHGKTVFSEKPISNTAAVTDSLYSAAARAGVPLFCSMNRRFDPSLRQMYERIKNGEVGKMFTVKNCARDHPLPEYRFLKISGGIYHDCATHDIDLVCWLVSDFPTTIYAVGQCHDENIKALGDHDTVVIVMTFPHGVMATIELSRHATYGYDQRCEVYGTKGMLISENQRPTELKHLNKAGATVPFLKHSFPQRYKESYENSLQEFVEVLEGTRVPLVTSEEMVKCSILASACEESVNTGQPVTINYSGYTATGGTQVKQ